MSRIEENSHLKFKPDMAMKVNTIECAKVKFLEDISRSLAVIADGDTNQTAMEADAYVRDHLLIQWLFARHHINDQIEDVYEEWELYLKGRSQNE